MVMRFLDVDSFGHFWILNNDAAIGFLLMLEVYTCTKERHTCSYVTKSFQVLGSYARRNNFQVGEAMSHLEVIVLQFFKTSYLFKTNHQRRKKSTALKQHISVLGVFIEQSILSSFA